MSIDTTPKRNDKIDFLRCIGTFLVILAHTNIPPILAHLRSFDVVLLVFISGMSFSYANEGNKIINWGPYVWKRIKKLVLPTYITITLVFLASYIACTILGRSQLFDLHTILKSYLFAGGIGYIWIVKVYLLTAMLSIPIYKLCKNTTNDVVFWGYLAIIYIITAFISKSLGNYAFVYQYFSTTIPYLVILAIGMRCCGNKKFLLESGIVGLFLFLCSALFYRDFIPESFKYPPEIYYLSYGLVISVLLYYLAPNKNLKIVSWLSRNSFTIYLFHIIVLFVTNLLAESKYLSWLSIWYMQYLILILVSVIATYVWITIKKHIAFKSSKRREII